MLNEYIVHINESTDTFIHDVRESSDYMTLIENQFDSYINTIKDFFVGKETEIKGIYDAIRNKSFPYNTLEIVDVNQAISLYKEYFDGMWEFICRVADLRDTDMVDPVNVQSVISRVRDRDKDFVNSIFGGDHNKKESVDINEAMKNIECLIYVNKMIPTYGKLICTLNKKLVTLNTKKYENEIKEGISILIASVSSFISHCITEVIQTYESITTSMQNRTPSKGIPNVPTYQMF